MKQLTALVVASVLMFTFASTLEAQSMTIPGESKTLKGTVERIEASTRMLTIKEPNGNYETMFVPPAENTRFSEIKVGDKMTVRYYDNVIVRLSRPGERSVNTASSAVTPGRGPQTAGTVAKQRTITATIIAIDAKVPSITLRGPNNWRYSSRVQDAKLLENLKVGDRLHITWTEAALISFESAEE